MMSRVVLLLGLTWTLLCPPAWAAIDDAEAMNLSGMQRMLSQRIAKSYLMIGAEVRSEQALQQLDQSVARFENNYQALAEYAPSAEIRVALEQVGESWQHYRELALSRPTREQAVLLLALSDQLLAQSEALVQLIEAHTGSAGARLVNRSGRQRMLSQRIAKSYLMIGSQIRPDAANQQLDQSLAKFESNYLALSEYAPSEEIRRELQVVEGLWHEYRNLVLETPDKTGAAEVLAQSDSLLAQCEKVVRLIEAHTGSRSAQLVNRSGRQRMLSQRIAKLYLAMSWHVPVAGLEQQFNQAVSEFDTALGQLQAAEENTPAIEAALKKSGAQWAFSRAGFRLSGDSRYVPTVITTTTETLLWQMNDLTTAYEGVMSSRLVSALP